MRVPPKYIRPFLHAANGYHAGSCLTCGITGGKKGLEDAGSASNLGSVASQARIRGFANNNGENVAR